MTGLDLFWLKQENYLFLLFKQNAVFMDLALQILNFMQ